MNSAHPSRKSPVGVLLLNLGTPEAPEPTEVRAYLKEFLMDPYVLDIPRLARWFLVHGAILPKRPITSAAAYKKVWTKEGSPLLVNLLNLTEKVTRLLGDGYLVRPGMRYGNPSIRAALEDFAREGVEKFILLPLYPQYSLAATESSVQECTRIAKEIAPQIQMEWVRPFFNHPLFIESFARVAAASLKGYDYDHVLFSFHGLPERQIKKTDTSGQHCLNASDCCEKLLECNRDCYRSQSYTTARLIAEKLGLSSDEYTVCFQSRLGNTPWIKPYTDALYEELPKRGIKKIAVICPAFVSDCLETLEEIQIRGREDFERFGGQSLRLVPSLNSGDFWAQSVAQMLEDSKSQV